MRGETQDAIILVFWTLFLIASFLFLFVLWLYKKSVLPDALVLFPFLYAMLHQQRKFTQDRRPIKAVWHDVAREQGYGEPRRSDPENRS
jgi:4-hydroxybenzoate polyprenyltransferase